MAAVSIPVLATPPVHRPRTSTVVLCTSSSDEWDDVDRALESLWRQVVRPEHVVIVVDHDDHLLEWAADAWSSSDEDGLMRVDVIANMRARGLAGSRDTGAAWSWGDVIAFLDHDAVAERDWIETMLEDYVDADVAGVGGGAIGEWDEGVPAWLPAEFGWAVGCSCPQLPEDPAEVPALMGANMSFRREVFAEIGGFSDAGDDATAFCLAIRRRYPLARLVFDPDLEVAQRMTEEHRSFARFLTQCFDEGRSAAEIARTRLFDLGLTPAFSRATPVGAARGIGDGLTGSVSGFQRAGAAVAGLACVAAGFARGRFQGLRRR